MHYVNGIASEGEWFLAQGAAVMIRARQDLRQVGPESGLSERVVVKWRCAAPQRHRCAPLEAMTAYCCPSCRIVLTFRPPEHRARQYCFPHSDDFSGCDHCGWRYCQSCANRVGHVCERCSGRLHDGASFEPKGRYRLPFGMTSVEAAKQKTEEMWRSGLLGKGEYRYALQIIEQVAAEEESGPTAP